MVNVRDAIKRKDAVEKLIRTIHDGTKHDVNMIHISKKDAEDIAFYLGAYVEHIEEAMVVGVTL